MTNDLAPALRAEIRRRVCARCQYGSAYDQCLLSAPQTCPIPSNIPLIFGAVNRAPAGSVDEYLSELPAIVCAQCAGMAEDGACASLLRNDCILVRNFSFIIETVRMAGGHAFRHH